MVKNYFLHPSSHRSKEQSGFGSISKRYGKMLWMDVWHLFATFGAGLVPEQTSQVAQDRTAQGQTAAQGGGPGI
jgi:hypothetical protein